MTQAKAILSLAVAGALLAGCGDKTKGSDAPAQPAAAGASSAAGASDAITPALKVALKSVRQASEVGGPHGLEKASEGGVLVVLDYTVTNTGAAPVAGWRRPVLKLVDASGTAHDTDLSKTMTYQLQDDVPDKTTGDLAAGAVVDDAAVFDVPKAGFDPATWSALVGETKIPLPGKAE